MRVPKKLWETVKSRDRGAYCCPCAPEMWVPQHRAGRGMGGSKAAHAVENVIVMCAEHNGMLESDAVFAAQGREFGWKIQRLVVDTPDMVPVTDYMGASWWLLADGTRRAA